jgi:hypothetical protein
MSETDGHYTMEIAPVVYETKASALGDGRVAVPDISPALPREVQPGRPEPK